MLVAGVHRSIRSLAPGEGPWRGTLVTDRDDVAVWCEIDGAADEIDWRFTGAAHVAAPTDIARSANGHGALLPWCTTRVTTFLARRTAGAAALDPGEWGTLVLSLLRGLREVAERADPAFAGQWWLTDTGRPLCVPGGTTTARDGAVEILGVAQAACSDRALRRILLGIQESVAEAMPTGARVRGWERELLDFAAPRALRLDENPLQAAPDVSVAQLRTAGSESPLRRRRVRSEGTPLRSVLEQASSWGTALIGRLRRPKGSQASSTRGRDTTKTARPRGRMILVAAATAAAVLGVGLLWPGDEPAPTQAAQSALDDAPPRPAATPVTSPSPGDEPDAAAEVAASAEDPVVAAEAVLAALDECAAASDESCAAGIARGSSARTADVLRSDAAGEPALVDDYGDLAVIKVGTPAVREQMLVLVRQNQRWLVRPGFELAGQPQL